MSATSSIGPISGIDYGALITGLTQSQQSSIDALTTRINTLDSQNQAILALSAMMTSLKLAATSFTTSAIFRSATATSANPSIMSALAGVGTPTGSYSFNVQRLASASQMVSQGFNDTTTALGFSGNITLQLGGGKLDDSLSLSKLNGGSGVSRGSIRITDKSGASTLLDLSQAVDVNDVVNTINSATGVRVHASVDNDHLVLTDLSGGTGSLVVANAGATTTASDLGLTAAASGNTLTGTSLTKLTATTNLNTLNDGNGVRTSSGGDFTITGSGGAFNVSLSTAKTVGDVITAINSAGQSAGVTASVSSDGGGITLTDSGGGTISVSALNGSLAAYDLGILGTGSSSGTLQGDRIASELTGPLLRDLNGGYQGQNGTTTPQFGTITINGESIDLSHAYGLNDVIQQINTNSQGVTASINQAGTGITLSSNASSFTVADGTGNLASFLHIDGSSTASATGSQTSSGDLRLRYVSDNTLLSSLNGGAGVKPGQISITDGNGVTRTIDLSTSDVTTIGSVIKKINQSGLAISARVNDTGDGILLTQTGGTLAASVQDINGGTTASDLNIAGTFSNNTLNGSYQKTISIAATDSLSNIVTKISQASPQIAASIINDGSGSDPYRLSLASRNSGLNGRIILDGSAIGLDTSTLVQGQDAVLVYGGNANGTGGLLTTSSSNTITGLVPSMTLTLTGTGATSITVNNDPSQVTTAVQNFVDAYNKIINNIADVTNFDPNNSANNGVLFGNASVRQVQNALGSFVTQTYYNVGSLHSLADVGITVGQDGTLSLDTDKLSQVLATSPDDVRTLFTTNIQQVAAGPFGVTATTQLSTLTGGGGFQPGHITITDGNGTAHDIDLSGASTIGAIITAINSGTSGSVVASLNSNGTGLTLTQIGGSGTARVDEANGGATAASLGIKGILSGGILKGYFAPVAPVNAVQGIGITLSNMLDTFTNAQTGQLFDASNSFLTQEQQLRDRQTSLSQLLTAKQNLLIMQFANLETTIAGFQAQGSSLASLAANLTSNSSSKSSS
ncbi:MAG: flagellar filament capping protein FliD [Phycisphaerales bacterium]|nr:flagellar filament capping protein FliD [Phycisphaerales bacterium]